MGGRVVTGDDRQTLEARYVVGETSCRNLGTLSGTCTGQGRSEPGVDDVRIV